MRTIDQLGENRDALFYFFLAGIIYILLILSNRKTKKS
jgi:hypothetical protein